VLGRTESEQLWPVLMALLIYFSGKVEKIHRNIKDGCLLECSTQKMEAVLSSETSVSIYQSTWFYIPKHGHPFGNHCEILKSHHKCLNNF
jgi:hypothetical protein